MQSFQPPRRILMGPGPSDVSPRVLAALARPTVGHLDPAFQDLMEEIKAALARLFNAPDHACVPLPAPGTAGMEAALMNLLEPGDRAVIAVNGVFGGRMADMAGRAGAEAVRVDAPWGEPVDVAAVEAALASGPAKVLAFVHAETSTGVRSDAAALCALARRHGALSIVDCVTSLGGVPVDAAAWDADVLYSGTQKCLSAPPGLSPVAFSRRALDAVAARTTPVRNWLLDVSLLMAYWGGEGGRTYHHTAPINALYGLHESLVALFEEGQQAVFVRHARMHEALVAGLEALGLEMLVAPEHRLPQLNTVRVPEGVDEAAVRAHMLARWDLEIGAGLGPLKGQVWRIGLMGASATPWHVRLCLTALADALAAQGRPVDLDAALSAAEARLG
ncbi:alanine--glyoxylate aminotransferase family protein [Phenylobacterium sp.]|uniref:pyridoxal-phosphate-dependent aminotransferase family protein n=1 Tax=Phenylobacterium sp. TaxID=1871053 RepID=UPI0025FD9416|nr:alanine--glyoxylate aminotransferase family protein [Phenylobacterium sp.]MCA6285001.1 alanine--glyoxylate aminotransferase family protein [Phenylobacterium sp.]MCA6289169.1 alanine--glyoxylate aminotransferase family protein [Phenylobacterium sp.]MCA6309113.1 alanine--glyoxylate aminotransferase family protein [Phenylobacterium sp.]MCA6322767.1 alanine--glyoxylate aminotransferase family protein [Phenylobacterium sp.]MCA6336674.1 alanine--glyoxylate aminotransferase family protein [Phenylo